MTCVLYKTIYLSREAILIAYKLRIESILFDSRRRVLQHDLEVKTKQVVELMIALFHLVHYVDGRYKVTFRRNLLFQLHGRLPDRDASHGRRRYFCGHN